MADSNGGGDGYMLWGGINEWNAFTCGKCEREEEEEEEEEE